MFSEEYEIIFIFLCKYPKPDGWVGVGLYLIPELKLLGRSEGDDETFSLLEIVHVSCVFFYFVRYV